MMRRWLIAIALLLLLGVVVTLMALSSHHRRAVERYRAELRAQGHLKNYAEIAPPPLTNGPNGAPALTNVMARLPSLPDYPAQPGGLASGTRRAPWREMQEPAAGQTNAWSPLLDFLRTHAADIAALRAACAEPAFDFAPRYADGERMTLAHLTATKHAVQVLAADALVQLHAGQAEAALADVQSGVNLTARWNREPTMITHLVRIAQASILSVATWDLLDRSGWTDAQLAGLQAAWQELDLPASADTTFALEEAWMERALQDPQRQDFSPIRSLMNAGGPDSDSLLDLVRFCLQDPKAGWEEAVDRYPRWWAFRLWRRHQLALISLQQHEAGRSGLQEAIASRAWLAPATAVSNQIGRLQSELPQMPGGFDAVGGSYLGRMLFKYATVETQRAVVLTAIALERYRLRHGSHPESLAELTPTLVSAVPIDPMDGKPLRFRRTEDGRFLLYSIGEDGRDDGGDPTPAGVNRFWAQGRDAVWPRSAPASSKRAE
jgi:hypothetical protein